MAIPFPEWIHDFAERVVVMQLLPARAESGSIIGGYELVRRIGTGGMAEVWVAHRPLGHKGTKYVAIKLIADHFVGDERYARMFKAEAELSAVLSHANIVQVFDEGEDHGRSYLVMEWVDGLNLLKLGAVLALLDDEVRRFRITAYIIGQLLYALSYAHSITSADGNPLGVVHRDVSPQNVLVSNHGEVKLTDFGVAHQAMEESSGIHVKGKVRYMAPEQLAGQTRSPTVDLFAVGALLHELLDGTKFRGEYENGQEMFSAVLAGTIPSLTRRAPPELDELRLRLLAADPADRIQTAEEALEWLQQYPGYGDARVDLTKLCGSLTGIVRPRAGPARSSQMTAARKKPQKLAKPKIAPSRGLASPSQSTTAPSGGSAWTTIPLKRPGSLESAESPLPAPKPPLHAVITGHTEFVSPQQLPKFPTVDPEPEPDPATAPNPAAVGVPASAEDPSSSDSVRLDPTENPLAPVSAAPARASHPIPVQTLVQPSHPIMVAASAEASGPGSSSPFPTAEVLHSSESSGESAFPATTQPLDPHQSTPGDPRWSGSGHDIAGLPLGMEGSDTSREIRRGSQTTISIALPRRSAIAGIIIGLFVIAGLSITLTWYLVTEGQKPPGTTVASSPEEVTESKKEATAPREEATEPNDEATAEPEPSLSESHGPPAELEPAYASETDGKEDGIGVATPEPVSTDVVGAEDPVAVAEPLADSALAAVEAESEDPVRSEREETKPTPPSKLKIRAAPGTKRHQLKIGTRVVEVGTGKTLRVSAGRKVLRWRTGSSASWKKIKTLTFKPGRTLSVFVTSTGVAQL